jgi:hypothetical protein
MEDRDCIFAVTNCNKTKTHRYLYIRFASQHASNRSLTRFRISCRSSLIEITCTLLLSTSKSSMRWKQDSTASSQFNSQTGHVSFVSCGIRRIEVLAFGVPVHAVAIGPIFVTALSHCLFYALVMPVRRFEKSAWQILPGQVDADL